MVNIFQHLLESLLMVISDTKILGLKVFEPKIYEDNRGLFFESFNNCKISASIGKDIQFVQDNHSISKKGVLRGLHYQAPPYSQGKLVRVIRGKVYDVAVDIRRSSNTFGEWFGIELSEKNRKQLWIPDGFAHGFVSLSENTEVVYKVTNYYKPEFERVISWDDQTISVDWPIKHPIIISEKDKNGNSFNEQFGKVTD